MIARLLDVTAFVSSNKATSLRAFSFRGHRLVLWSKCEETECNADMS